MENLIANGQFLQQIYNSLSEDLLMQSLNPAALARAININPDDINNVVDNEVNAIRQNILRKEQLYVDEMLRENPIEMDRRSNNMNVQQQTSKPDNEKFLQQQKAEACRRSRYVNKVKKAKLKFRHKYISQKLLQSAQMLDSMQELITQAENQFRRQGLPEENLQQLQQKYKMDYVKNLNETIKMEEQFLV